ncbi:MAG: PilN domain-containing protein [Planctomycetota bacterium]|jgi:Tfp pilus assembly protein PilN
MNTNASFLPDDYLDQKAERRTNLISLVLFAVVMLGVFLAFLVTNQKWSDVKDHQERINSRYQEAAQQITELVELEEQKSEMLLRAEIAAALVERVPRSVLLAELINRMPPRLALLEFDLESEKVKPAIPRVDKPTGAGTLKPTRAKTKAEATKDQKKIRPPKYRVKISLVGVAPSGEEVSKYLADLNTYGLLRDVNLEYTEEKELEGLVMQKFAINMRLNPEADVRDIDPRIVPRHLSSAAEPSATEAESLATVPTDVQEDSP